MLFCLYFFVFYFKFINTVCAFKEFPSNFCPFKQLNTNVHIFDYENIKYSIIGLDENDDFIYGSLVVAFRKNFFQSYNLAFASDLNYSVYLNLCKSMNYDYIHFIAQACDRTGNFFIIRLFQKNKNLTKTKEFFVNSDFFFKDPKPNLHIVQSRDNCCYL